MSSRFWNRLWPIVLVVLGVLLALELISRLLVELFWFEEVDYLAVFFKRFLTQLGLWVVVCSTSAFIFLGNFLLAERLKYPIPSEETRINLRLKTETVGSMGLRLLLPVVLVLSLLMSLMLLHYLQISLSFWQSGWQLPFVSEAFNIPGSPENYALPNVETPLAPPLTPTALRPLWGQLVSGFIWQIGIVVVVVVLIFFNLRVGLSAIALLLSLFFGLVLSSNWSRVLLFFNATAFGAPDPVFNRDVGFYVFRLPIWELLSFWFSGLASFSLLAVSLIYLLSGKSFSQGLFPGFSLRQLRHLYGLGGIVLLALSFRHGLARYELLYSQRGVTYGASFTDVNIQIPVETVLSLLASVVGTWLVWRAIASRSGKRPILGRSPLYGIAVYLVALLIGLALGPAIQRLVVQPNELELERPYIERSIFFTRSAFNLDSIEVSPFDPQGQLSAEDIAENERTIDNIRIWDARPLLQTNRQLQQIRPYYRFPDADIDRYTLLVRDDDQVDARPLAAKQQVLISARELDYEAVPEQAQTWVNKHLLYTHGYGFTMAPVNEVGAGGLPNYFVRDIGPSREVGEAGALQTSDLLIRYSIPIGNPRIYYGELTNTYVLAPSRQPELDFPTQEGVAYNTYNGRGGIPLGSFWRRVVVAEYFKDWRMLFTENLLPETKLLFRRNVRERVEAIAPFLRFDNDPYLVTANTGESEAGARNYLHWIIDAYTISDRYPYADPGKNRFNYIRNSVKIVVDAYDGTVRFYIVNFNDPIVRAWNQIFPGLFQPLAEMPPTLRSHIRYPSDLFRTQSEQLLTYHMTDPRVFYNREDQWQIPQEIYGGEPQRVEPYYLILKLPTAAQEEFIILLPFTPAERNNLIGWLAGRSDANFYGRQLLYEFPRQELVYGPEQIEALINQDPVISQQISLWNRQGSRVIQGNLLVIPIEQSLLYVEPLYLEAERNSLPTLARVIVVYENQIVMAPTLQESLSAIFEPGVGEGSETPAIIRPFELDPQTPILPPQQQDNDGELLPSEPETNPQ